MQRNGPISPELEKACSQEPIQLLGAVQPHGFLIAADVDSGRIVQVSSGIARHWPGLQGAEALAGELLSDWIEGIAPLDTLALQSLPPSPPIALAWRARFERTCADRARQSSDWECLGHRSGRLAVFEWLPQATNAGQMRAPNRGIPDVAGVIACLRQADKMESFLADCARVVQGFADFDRVMIYRFLSDGCGEVVAEHTGPECRPKFMGLRFPASDIPPQARARYLTDRLRVVADVEATPDTLVPPMPAGAAPLDQSHCMLRGLSQVHLSYLHNMGVRAALTMSIVIDGKLWGLIACHHHAPKLPPHQLREGLRQICELTAEVTSMRIETLSRIEAPDHNRTLHEKLHWRGHHDQLTGLYNRATMEDEVTRRLEHGQYDCALMLLDLDHFKKINDACGHATGDQVLLQFGRRLGAAIRDCDLLARLGGDEFMLLFQMDQPDAAIARGFAERLHQTITTPFDINGRQLRMTVSVGIALPPAHGRTASELLRRADLALYHAKSQGRSRSAVFDFSMESDLIRGIELRLATAPPGSH